MTPRFRHTVAVILLVATALLLAVALSQFLVGSDSDPRDTLGSRAAGFGFTDHAHATLFSAAPLGLPVLAGLIARKPSVHLAAAVEYALLIIAGAVLAGSAFLFGINAAAQQTQSAGTVFIDSRSAVEQLLGDATLLVLAGVGMAVNLRAWRMDRAAAKR
ncbi:MAG TPA: hypothetical protein VE172_24675 [Stackebrandtia sp.]|uniref:hypothetical protein n=1 Tax=Stackebrandtia sp. TaxID=2023065 RepID=UPI002D54DB3D|nr:hypothetical protein [Stackebrandtia sp.]HZE42003.1 hypothetical protein [Stackebrandtia sp.]